MTGRVQRGSLRVAKVLDRLIEQDILPGTGISSTAFWKSFERIIDDLTPINNHLLGRRVLLQQQINRWHNDHPYQQGGDYQQAYQAHLKKIGYLLPEPPTFTIATEHVDPEVATIAGPQLVVPVSNARYALNAANARWGSLYDALYGTDVISEDHGLEKDGVYNPARGEQVVKRARQVLESIAPLSFGHYDDIVAFTVKNQQLSLMLVDGQTTDLAHPERFVGYCGSAKQPSAILLKNHGLHLEIQIDRNSPVGAQDLAGIKDVLVESAITTIMDCEDSVAAVDADDKVLVYRNWLGLMKSDLEADVTKGSHRFIRTLNPDREYTSPFGKSFTLPGRSLMFVRNVGHLMTSDAILDQYDEPVYEGIMDAMVTSLIALHDLHKVRSSQPNQKSNSRTGSIYIVKPKMHGPAEVAFTNTLFDRVEQALGLPVNTIKMGIMDEERRTTLNLAACIYEARERVVFINTGFLDRTGDEIHTDREAGPMIAKNDMKQAAWLNAYEQHNVQTGLVAGFHGRAQIGKGMWPMPDCMAEMMAAKISHPLAGASTAWVPSPTAATLHALHYHQVNVSHRQQSLLKSLLNQPPANLTELLTLPVLADATVVSEADKQRELDNNVQGILGYVVRWVDQGIGCSKVPNIDQVALMEDRATLRISSQHIANWLRHGLCTRDQVQDTLERMARVVDQQNSGDPAYRPMAPDFANSHAFQAASDLIFKGADQPNGYTEPLLHAYRRAAKMAR